MAEDQDVLRELWDGKLPICFQLAPEEASSLSSPDKFYLMVPRLSYFPLVTDKVRKHFIQYISHDMMNNELWLEYDNQPLKWHYPIGLLYDMNYGSIKLPWCITVHFNKFPETVLMHCKSKEYLESHFMSTVKEADALKHRGTVISNMQKKDHNQLWMGLQNDKMDQFWTINRKLMEPSSGEETFKYIPFRLYKNDKPLIQKLVKPLTSDGQRKCLKDLLQEVLPDSGDKDEAIIHGVECPTDTPLQWLSEHMSYPDNFLHICIINS